MQQLVTGSPTQTQTDPETAPVEVRIPWPVDWSALWAGTLASLAALVLLGLIGVAVGAHLTGPEERVVDLKKIGLGTLAYSIFSAFLAFVLGGWVAGRIAGNTHAEPAILHGVGTWLLALPIVVALAGLGAGGYLGGWYGGLAATPRGEPFVAPTPLNGNATTAERERYEADLTAYRASIQQWREDTPRVVRNSALGAVTALLLGLMGAVVGGWMACGEPLNPWYLRPTRTNKTIELP